MPGIRYLTTGRRLLLSVAACQVLPSSDRRPASIFPRAGAAPPRGTGVLRKMCPSIHCPVAAPGIMWESNPGWPQPVGTPVSGGSGGLAVCGSPGWRLLVGRLFICGICHRFVGAGLALPTRARQAAPLQKAGASSRTPYYPVTANSSLFFRVRMRSRSWAAFSNSKFRAASRIRASSSTTRASRCSSVVISPSEISSGTVT